MLNITKEMLQEAHKLVTAGEVDTKGYRIAVRSFFPGDAGSLNMSESEKFETLAKSGFITETKQEAKRQERGTNFGIVIDIGGAAFKGSGESFDCVEGDVLVMARYEGAGVEIPPHSGNEIRFINDESILATLGNVKGGENE